MLLCARAEPSHARPPSQPASLPKSHAAGNCQPSQESRQKRAPCPRLRENCHMEYRREIRGDPMAEASVLAAPGAQLADKSHKALWAAGVGNLLEWYDFGVYAYLASLIATKFFPNSDPAASLLAAFAAYGVGFLARPLGGIVIGRLGDTKGRKTALVLTIFLMAFGTVGLGLLPSYDAIGVWAPILLVTLRLVQGIAAGGEWGTSTAFMVEWAPENRRGFFGSLQQVSTAGR